jgi:hypothetical protein
VDFKGLEICAFLLSVVNVRIIRATAVARANDSDLSPRHTSSLDLHALSSNPLAKFLVIPSSFVFLLPLSPMAT